MSEAESCSVCGRTILAGERTLAYLTPDGDTKAVCELCRDRAESLGWVWEEIVDQPPATPPRRRRGAGLAAFFRGREHEPPAATDILENGHDPVAQEAEPEEPAEPEQPAEPETPPPPPPRGSPDPAAPGAGLGRSAPAPESPATRLERAVARFNASEHARTVAGLTRTLGLPSVSVGAAAGSPSEVRITVAWELSWYQWGVDLKDETRSIYEIDKGHEMNELDSSARQWNATSAEDGRVRLGAPVA